MMLRLILREECLEIWIKALVFVLLYEEIWTLQNSYIHTHS